MVFGILDTIRKLKRETVESRAVLGIGILGILWIVVGARLATTHKLLINPQRAWCMCVRLFLFPSHRMKSARTFRPSSESGFLREAK